MMLFEAGIPETRIKTSFRSAICETSRSRKSVENTRTRGTRPASSHAPAASTIHVVSDTAHLRTGTITNERGPDLESNRFPITCLQHRVSIN